MIKCQNNTCDDESVVMVLVAGIVGGTKVLCKMHALEIIETCIDNKVRIQTI